jgi:hypothetical protein
MRKLLFPTMLLLLFYLPAAATHLQSGHITYVHLEGRSYSIILTVYSDMNSPVMPGTGILDFGDGSSQELNLEPDDSRITRTRTGNTWKSEIVIEHTYSSPGNYTISYQEPYRNEGIMNMKNSADMAFYIESLLIVDAAFMNNSVTITKTPLHQSYQQQTYHYNPGAYDPDGDSLSFHLIPSMQDKNTPVADYTFPHVTFEQEGASEAGESAYFTINPNTGDIVWDAPLRIGGYTIAYEIREWRLINETYKQIGRVMHDLTVMVGEEASPGLELIFPVETNAVQLERDTPWEMNIRALAGNPEDTVVLLLSGSLLQQSPLQLNPADSSGGKGETAITLRYTPAEAANTRHQLIATAYIYSENDDPGISRTRSAYLLSPGFISSASDLPVKNIRLYPNPASSHGFFLDYALLEGREVSISLFATDGRMVFHQSIPSFSGKEAVVPGKKLNGYYLAVIRQGKQVYTSSILFSD